jgi:hypothetical protein
MLLILKALRARLVASIAEELDIGLLIVTNHGRKDI